MLPTTSLLQLALCLSTFGHIVAASGPLPRYPGLIARQDDADETTSENSVIEPTGTEESGSGTAESEAPRTSGRARNTGDSLNTVEPQETDGTRSGSSGSRTGTRSSSPTRTQYPPDQPPGGVEMITPTAIAGSTPLYKIGNEVEWAWNYTSLRGTPNNIDVLISCATATSTWTLSANMSFATSVNFTWDTTKERDDSENPLLTELYTLIVKDSEAEISDSPEAGYLGVYSGFTFGLYYPQSYTEMPDWKCVACNSAPSLGGEALGLAAIMSLVSVLSFTWFVTGLGLH